MKKVIYTKKTPVVEQELGWLSRIALYIFAFSLMVTLMGLLLAHYVLEQKIQSMDLSVNSQHIKVSQYPFFLHPFFPEVSAQSVVILDDASKVILYSKNPNLRFSTASTAKIMTALIALTYFKPDDILEVKDSAYEGTVVGFPRGEKLYFDDVFSGMLLASGNDAAFTIGQNYPGGIRAFVEKMNEKAKMLHLLNTHFADPAGLDDDGNYTTATDLARLCSVAMQDKTFARTVNTKHKTITNVSGANSYEVFNLNRLLGNYGVVGIKTGRTVGAGEVLTTAKMENGKLLIIVVMQSSDRFFDMENILNNVSGNVGFVNPLSQE